MAQEITLSYLLTRALKRHAARVAVVEGERSKTYAQLDVRSRSLASALREMGCEPGDRVAIAQQVLAQMRPDEARGTCHQHVHATPRRQLGRRL